MAIKQYRKKPVVISAVEWNGANQEEVTRFVGSASNILGPEPEVCIIETLEGNMRANRGDFIIKGVQGEFYPCKPDIFSATYEEVLG